MIKDNPRLCVRPLFMLFLLTFAFCIALYKVCLARFCYFLNYYLSESLLKKVCTCVLFVVCAVESEKQNKKKHWQRLKSARKKYV